MKYVRFFIRFTDEDNNVMEEFIDFIPLIRIAGKIIATAIKQTLEEFALDM